MLTLSMRMLSFLLAPFFWLWRSITDSIRELCFRIFLAILLFFGYLSAAMISYAILRQLLVPQKTHVLPVHLYFHPQCREDSGAERVAVARDEWLSPSGRQPVCPYPWAEFHLAAGERMLSPGQSYTVTLEIDVPESPRNEELGLFMVNATFFSHSGFVLASSARLTMLHYKSPLLRWMSALFFSLPLMLGVVEEKQHLSVLMMDDYYEPFTEGAIYSRVTILTNKLQVYSVELTFDANFTGLAHYLYHWPITMAVLVILSLFISLCTVTLLVWSRRMLDRLGWLTGRHQQAQGPVQGGRHGQTRDRAHRRQQGQLAAIPEGEREDGENQDRHVEDLSSTSTTGSSHEASQQPTGMDSMESSSTISSVSEVATTDLSELDSQLQQLHQQAVGDDHSVTGAVRHRASHL